MKISSNYCSVYPNFNSVKPQGIQQSVNREYNNSSSVPFCSIFSRGPKDTDRTMYGTTYGEERVARQAAEAHKRLIQRETLKESPYAWVREESDNVGKNPAWDEYLTQREFDRYHAEVMAKREAEEAKLAAAAGKKNYEGDEYTVCDRKGRVVERGRGGKWESRYEYDITYPVNRFGEYYTMKGAVKETRPDDTYVIRVSPNSAGRLEEKFKNKSIEYVDNCTGKIKSVKLPNGGTFGLSNRLMTVKQTEISRQYFSQYDDEKVLLEVFDDGSYKRA